MPLLGAAGAALFGFVRLIQPPRVRDSAASRSACTRTRSRSSSAELTAERDCSWQCHSFCSCAYSSEMHTCAYSVQYVQQLLEHTCIVVGRCDFQSNRK